MTQKIYLLATEPSGDALGAEVIDALRDRQPDCIFCGIGGAHMAKRGIQSPFDISDLAILGFIEGIKAYKLVKARVEAAAQDIMREAPDAVVLIDSWGFMWRVGQRLGELGYQGKRIKLIGPQVWATRPGRARVLAQHVDHLLCIHAFEEPFYKPFDLPTTVIGNPALGRFEAGDPTAFRRKYGIDDDRTLIGLLPGSRRSEVQTVSPVLEQAAQKLCATDDKRLVACVAAPSIAEVIKEKSQSWSFPFILVTDEDDKADAFAAMDLSLTCSGTVTTEVALQGTPIIVGYKIGWLTWAIARAFLMKSKYITLLNVAAGGEVAPEFVQTRFTAKKLHNKAEGLLSDQGQLKAQTTSQFSALDKMGRGEPPAAQRSAQAILDILNA